jgi:hypothetical protein
MEIKNLAFEVCLFILRCDILHAVTFFDMGRRLYFPSERRRAADFYHP